LVIFNTVELLRNV